MISILAGSITAQALPQFPDHDPMQIIIGSLVVGSIVLFFIIGAFMSKGGQSSSKKQPSKGLDKRRFKKVAFSKGLNKNETAFLEHLLKELKVPRPNEIFTSSMLLDKVLANAIEKDNLELVNEQVKEERKLTLYRIKQKIENSSGNRQPIHSTTQLTPGLEIDVAPEGGIRNQSKIISVPRDGIVVQIPIQPRGSEVRWKKWTGVHCSFRKPNGQAYSFPSKVLGYSTVQGAPRLILQHSKKITQGQQRKHRRKDLHKPVYFYPIRIVPTGFGKNQEKKAIVDSDKGTLGTVLEVSPGGCSIRTTYPIPKGRLIKLEFETEKRVTIAVYGKVKHVRKSPPAGGVMHIQFTRISRRNLNKINSFVYEL